MSERNRERSLARVLHASQLVTLGCAPEKRPRVGAELSELAIIRDGGMLIRDGKIESVGPSDEIEKESRGERRLSMLAGALCCRDLSMRTRIWFLPEIASTISSGVRAAKRTSKSAKAGGGIWSTVEKTRAASEHDLLAQAKKHANGFYAAGLRLSKRNPATG